MKKQVGEFSYENEVVSGPATYMQERGSDLIVKMADGTDEILDRFLQHAEPEMAVLLRLHNDYCAWIGQQNLKRALGVF